MRLWRKFKRWRYERWAVTFSHRNDLPFEGVMMLAGYKVASEEIENVHV